MSQSAKKISNTIHLHLHLYSKFYQLILLAAVFFSVICNWWCSFLVGIHSIYPVSFVVLMLLFSFYCCRGRFICYSFYHHCRFVVVIVIVLQSLRVLLLCPCCLGCLILSVLKVFLTIFTGIFAASFGKAFFVLFGVIVLTDVFLRFLAVSFVLIVVVREGLLSLSFYRSCLCSCHGPSL